MTTIKFTKMHGLGNDFVVIDLTKQQVKLNQQQIKFIANRKIGIGCDQVLLIEKIQNTHNQYNYYIYNGDGSVANHCGNGARCVIKYLHINDNTIDKNAPIVLHTKNYISSGDFDMTNNLVSVDMGTASFNPQDLPFIYELNPNNCYNILQDGVTIEFGIVSVGNPHVIIALNNQTELANLDKLKAIATHLQNSKYFPESVNVNFYYKINNNTINLITYERGAGFTQACGTGACATIVYLVAQKLIDNHTVVNMNGGSLNINIHNNHITMIGDAVIVFDGTITL